MTLQPHQQRAVAEKAELDTRLDALNAFRDSITYLGLSVPDQVHLTVQAFYMTGYSEMLAIRIKNFTEAAK